ncbi:unnamed protein product [Blepharisma stoltei]|uniref:Arf-GAP domain-containing protein n=1 Tax=Blepharisma stoltei TaxID=1481888 RepID=A0AAU9INS4_9CILI|nr:unnamed protein product [Blepharisma stoltei]
MNTDQRVSALFSKPGNQTCADCNSRNPRWLSIPLGVFICIQCSGMHRHLGTHISFVRSATLDKWTPEQLHIFERLDNNVANAYWEKHMQDSNLKPKETDSPQKVLSFLREKYEHKKWVNKDELNPVQRIKRGETVQQPKAQEDKQPKAQAMKPRAPQTNSINLLDGDFIAPSSQPRNAVLNDDFIRFDLVVDVPAIQETKSINTWPATNSIVFQERNVEERNFKQIEERNTKTLDDRDKKIRDVMAMYNNNSLQSPDMNRNTQQQKQQFQSLGALAAQKFLSGERADFGYSNSYWPSF